MKWFTTGDTVTSCRTITRLVWSRFLTGGFAASSFLLAVDESTQSGNFNHTISFLTGLALLVSLQVFLAEYENLVGWWLSATFWHLSLLIAARKSLPRLLRGGLRFTRKLLGGFSLVLSAFVVWLYSYLRFPAIRQESRFSDRNNDLAIYVVRGDNLLNAWFREFGRVVSYQAGALANFEVTGSSSLIATVCQFTQQSVWRSTNLSMLLLLAFTTIGIYVLLRPKTMPILIALPGAVWTMSSSYARLPQQN